MWKTTVALFRGSQWPCRLRTSRDKAVPTIAWRVYSPCSSSRIRSRQPRRINTSTVNAMNVGVAKLFRAPRTNSSRRAIKSYRCLPRRWQISRISPNQLNCLTSCQLRWRCSPLITACLGTTTCLWLSKESNRSASTWCKRARISFLRKSQHSIMKWARLGISSASPLTNPIRLT